MHWDAMSLESFWNIQVLIFLDRLFILSIEQMRKSGSLALWARLEFMGKPYLATYINGATSQRFRQDMEARRIATCDKIID